MRINHNIAALNTHRQLSMNNTNTGKSLEKLSSGLRINRAGDDAAGLAISEKMRGQIRGLDQANRNAQDGISLIQTAEGALNETHSILQRMRELAVQSSNDTNTADDRAEIQKEIDQLASEINRVANDTEFNTKKLLTGNLGLTISDSQVFGNVDMTSDTQAATYTIDTTGLTLATGATATMDAAVDQVVDATGTFTVNGTSFDVTLGESYSAVIDRVNSANIGVTADLVGNAIRFTTDAVGSDESLSLTGLDNLDSTATATANTTGTNLAGLAAGDITGGTTNPTGISIQDNTVTVQDGSAKGLTFTIKQAGTAAETITAGSALSLQIGANENQEMSLTINNMSSSSLGVNALDVSTQSGATAAITKIDTAINTVSSERAKLGAYQNRLEHTINNLGTSSENLSAAESRIRDVDYALAA